jgi:hypothetical protein
MTEERQMERSPCFNDHIKFVNDPSLSPGFPPIPPNAAKQLLHPVIRKSIVCRASLVTTKRDGGINARRKVSWNIAGKQRNACKQERNRTQGNRVAGANLE